MEQPTASPKSQLHLNLDYRLLVAVLLIIIAVMLALWRPWVDAPSAKDRTIAVTGTATLTAEPDEFVFTPTYEYTGDDKDATLKQVSDKSNEVVAGLKKLGVASSKIKTNANSWSYPRYNDAGSTPTYMLNVTATVAKADLAQKVEDYLLGTAPTGSLTPQANFSTAKQKELQSTARDNATKEARAKADQTAKNLGFSVGAVKAVDDGAGFGSPIYPLSANASTEDSSAKSSLTLQPGENTLNYSVTVTYYIK